MPACPKPSPLASLIKSGKNLLKTPLPLIVLAGLPAHAQESVELREVVVSASGFEQELRQAPASIAVVTRQDLETRQFRDLAEALRHVEGVDVRGATGKTGGLNISIRGLPSDYTLILIDGRRQNAAGNVTPTVSAMRSPVSCLRSLQSSASK
jgi:outer membrane receptor for ferrienterochelin and colicins